MGWEVGLQSGHENLDKEPGYQTEPIHTYSLFGSCCGDDMAKVKEKE